LFSGRPRRVAASHGRNPSAIPRRSRHPRLAAAGARSRPTDADSLAVSASARPEPAPDLTGAAAAFGAVMAELDAPMLAVTCRTPAGDPAGCLVGFATQSSIEPPGFLVCISRANHTFPAAVASAALAVHLVPRSATALARLLGGETGDEIDKFSRCAWHPGPCALPLLDECPNWFAGRVREQLDLGDHAGFLLDPLAAAHQAGHVALGQRWATAEIEPGHPSR
jgi:flavin reductase (DIM6/NTAB) family NADH-FMN oxidoreductase RutF